jgi:hypothetical protein
VSDITITAMEPGRFGVQLREGPNTTSHQVHVPEALLDDLGIADVDHEVVVRESMAFLLEREPAASILPEFSLDDIPRFFPEYHDELKARLAG